MPTTKPNQIIMSKLDKLVASNTLNANQNLMEACKESNPVMYLTLKWECDHIKKRYPSLA